MLVIWVYMPYDNGDKTKFSEELTACVFRVKDGGSYTHFKLGTYWRWVVSFTLRPLYSRWKNAR